MVPPLSQNSIALKVTFHCKNNIIYCGAANNRLSQFEASIAALTIFATVMKPPITSSSHIFNISSLR